LPYSVSFFRSKHALEVARDKGMDRGTVIGPAEAEGLRRLLSSGNHRTDSPSELWNLVQWLFKAITPRNDIGHRALIADNDNSQVSLVQEDELEAWRREAQVVELGG
jgi:hypothetical protein